MGVQIKHIRRDLKIITVYVTHDQIETMTLADRIVIMDGGRIQQIGTPDQICNGPANSFVASFIGAPPMNLIDGTVQDGVFQADGMRIGSLPKHHQGNITLGIRPEDCQTNSTKGHLKGTLYGIEPTGDTTYLTIKTANRLFEVKAERNYKAEPGKHI